jgi:membrane protein implicated in regulation of membrane protease activity
VLSFLTGASPWWWIVAGLVIGSLELLTFSFLLIWPGLAAVAVGVALFVHPALSGEWQVALFGLLAIGFTIAGRALRSTGQAEGDRGVGALNRRGVRLVGREVVIRSLSGDVAEVEVDGELWRARSPEAPLAAGAAAEVVAVEGAMLVVRPR